MDFQTKFIVLNPEQINQVVYALVTLCRGCKKIDGRRFDHGFIFSWEVCHEKFKIFNLNEIVRNYEAGVYHYEFLTIAVLLLNPFIRLTVIVHRIRLSYFIVTVYWTKLNVCLSPQFNCHLYDANHI